MFRLGVQISDQRFGWLYFWFICFDTVQLIHFIFGYKIFEHNNFALLVFALKNIYLFPQILGNLIFKQNSVFLNLYLYMFLLLKINFENTFLSLCSDLFYVSKFLIISVVEAKAPRARGHSGHEAPSWSFFKMMWIFRMATHYIESINKRSDWPKNVHQS